ncbi:aldo/keto reductase [uncultured Paracoccus sp.]|uniref:aldo/keto reductase n=1 Tax=uncultured Paracoccus sp. TaxID=189685 RepID=UPI00260889D6|nr:aldo/keto reductase [uncultured Paracoccus sp.]
MQTRKLGADGPEIGAVALGTMNFVGAYAAGDPDEALRCMARCLDLGINHFDTSNVYGKGRAEELLSGFLKTRRDQVVLASKVGITREKERPFNNEPDYLRDCLDASLKRLKVDHLDLYYIHRRDPSVPVEEVIGQMARFRDEGKIRAIGLSEIAPATLERAAAVAPIAAVQSEYSLWTRLPELGLVQACARHGAALVAFSALGRGVLTDAPPQPEELREGDLRRGMPRFDAENFPRNMEKIARFADYAHEIGHSAEAVALAWLLSRAPHVIALPGSRSTAHMEANAKGGELVLTDAQLAEIETLLPVGFAHGARYNRAMSRGPEAYC